MESYGRLGPQCITFVRAIIADLDPALVPACSIQSGTGETDRSRIAILFYSAMSVAVHTTAKIIRCFDHAKFDEEEKDTVLRVRFLKVNFTGIRDSGMKVKLILSLT